MRLLRGALIVAVLTVLPAGAARTDALAIASCSGSTTRLNDNGRAWQARLTGQTCGECGLVNGEINWGDESVGESQVQKSPNVDFSWVHTYARPGIYHVRMDMDDARGNRCKAESTITVN